MKRLLVEQAGNKCANPGCPNRLIELHHIQEWHVYHTHDAEHMIAICPACHDSVDRGLLQISDETLYRWKRIDRSRAPSTGHIYVEPGAPPALMLGSMVFRGESGVVVFDMAERHRLSFAVRDNDILLLNLKLSDASGNPLLDVVDGYVRTRSGEVELRTRPGKVYVPGGFRSRFVPEWVRQQLMQEDSTNAIIKLPLLSIEVMKPGLVKVQGLWLEEDRGFIISHDKFSMLGIGRIRPVSMIGEGEDTVIYYVGPVGAALFSLTARPAS